MLQSKFNVAYTKNQTYKKINFENQSLDYTNNVLRIDKVKRAELKLVFFAKRNILFYMQII